MATLLINGEPRDFALLPSIPELIDLLGLTGKRIALERNGDIVPRGRFEAQPLAEGDRLEIVVAVGGG